MRKFYKISALVLSIIMALLLMTFTSSADNNTTVQVKAEALGKVKILLGDGGDYNLTGKLKRSEASTFIVRLLGKESYVLGNKDSLDKTIYPDVPSSQWYAPYVGYCSSQGIISGDENGNYLPDDTISEKAFLKLVICALGYTYNSDFSWDTVYQKAYEIGIVNDSKYITQKTDNMLFTRSGAVDALYEALNRNLKGEDQTLLKQLIDDKSIDTNTAAAAGLLSNQTASVTFAKTSTPDKNTLQVELSKPVRPLTAGQVKIYQSDDPSKVLDITAVSQQGNTLKVSTADQGVYEGYTVELSGIRDDDGIFNNVIKGSFTGYRDPEIKSDFFKISKVTPLSNTTVDLYFTHPINSNCELPTYYEISDGSGIFASGATQSLTAKVGSSDKDSVLISLNGKTFSANTVYTLTVSGDVTSIYGVKLNEGQGDSATQP